MTVGRAGGDVASISSTRTPETSAFKEFWLARTPSRDGDAEGAGRGLVSAAECDTGGDVVDGVRQPLVLREAGTVMRARGKPLGWPMAMHQANSSRGVPSGFAARRSPSTTPPSGRGLPAGSGVWCGR
jgi:hypothetical protein